MVFGGEVSDVVQRQISFFEWEDYYQVYVRLPDQSFLDVWVTYDGEITDGMFLRNWEEEINQYFERIVKKEVPGCRIISHTTFYGKPSAELQQGDDIKQYLLEQPTYSNIRIFVDRSAGEDERILDRPEEVLKGPKVGLPIYVCDDVNSVDFDNLSPYSYTYLRELNKPEKSES